jgi:hypothetical protein
MALTRIRAQQISNIDYKQAVRVVTISNINLTGGAPSSVDGVALSVNSRILVNGQSTQTQNGLYLVQTVGTGSNGTWVRTNDTNTTGEMEAGMVVTVTEGNTYRDTLWTLTTDDPVVIGSSNITFQQSTSFSFGNIAANGTAILANTVGDGVTFTAGNNIAIVGNATAKTVTFGVTGIQSTEISNGTSNVQVVSLNGDVTVGINGTGNIAVFDTSGLTVTGNIAGDYFLGNGSQLTGIVAGGGITWTTQANTAPGTPAAGDFWYDSYTDKKYQYTNDGFSSYWIDQSFPTSYSSLAVTGNIVAGNVLITGNIVGNIVAETITANVIGTVTGNLTGNVFGNLIGNSYGNSTGTHIGNVIGNLTGAVLTAAQPAITSLGTLSSLTVTGNVTTSAYFFGDGSQLTGISSTGSFIANGTSNVSIASTNGNIAAVVGGTEILKISSVGIENSRANGVGNIGSSTTYFNTVFAKATSAQYADLAEMYIADAVYPPGTVLIFGGTHEVTASSISHDPRTAGVVSTNPSYLMNSGLAGPNTAAVALTGRVPCWVQGPVAKGDRLVNIDTGVAGRLDMDKYEVGCVIGKSLEAIKDSSLHLIEIAIGRY